MQSSNTMKQEANEIKTAANPVREYKEVCELIKKLEKEKEGLRGQIINLMDERKVDALALDGFKAERKLVVQERVDSKKVRDIMGDDVKLVLSECEVIRLVVI